MSTQRFVLSIIILLLLPCEFIIRLADYGYRINVCAVVLGNANTSVLYWSTGYLNIYTGTYRILSLFENITEAREVAVTLVGGIGGLCRNARPLLFRRERARAHTRTRIHIHPYIDTRKYPPLAVKSIYFINYYYYCYFLRCRSNVIIAVICSDGFTARSNRIFSAAGCFDKYIYVYI